MYVLSRSSLSVMISGVTIFWFEFYRHPDLRSGAGVALAEMGLVGGQHPQLPDAAVEAVPVAGRHVEGALQLEVALS